MSFGTQRVLVTDGQERSAVAVCWSLARAGFIVTVVADSHPAVAQWSRFCAARVSVPPPQSDAGQFIAILESTLRRAPHALLLSGGDASLEVISAYRARLEPLLEGTLGLPAGAVVSASLDKLSLNSAAEDAGFRTADTVACASATEAAATAEDLGYPVIVKPRRSVFERDGEGVREPSRRATNERELGVLARRYGGSCLIQPVEHGTVHSCAGVYAGGRMLALSLARYIRTWPPDAGNAALAETVVVPPALPQRVAELLERIGWEGIFELELLRRKDGSFAPLDLNPRTFGSIALAIRAGADLPAVWCDWLLGRRREITYARPGVLYRWEDGELRRLLWEVGRHNARGALTVLRPHVGTVHPQFSGSDPAPLAACALYLLRRKLAQRRRNPRHRVDGRGRKAAKDDRKH